MLAGWPLLTSCIGYCGKQVVGLVFASSVSWWRGSASSPWCCFPASSVSAFSFDVDDEERAVDRCLWFMAALFGARAWFFYPQESVSCLFSPVTRGGSHGCFGPALEDSTRCLLSFCSCSCPNRVSHVRSTENTAGFGIHRRPRGLGGHGGTPYVGLVFALSLSWCYCWLWRCVSSMLLSRFLRAGVQL